MLTSYKNLVPPDGHSFIQTDKYDHLSDNDIVEKIKNGATPLFEVIMRRYNERLFRVQRSYISDENAIKDTLQTTYIKVFENLQTFRGDALFSTWITRIAINEALKHINNEKRYTRLYVVGDQIPDNDQQMNQDNSPETRIIRKDLKKLLESTVNRLPSKYKAVYMMREVEEMSTKETADCLNISRANVKIRLFRSKQMLRKDLEQKAGDAEIFNFRGYRCDLLVYRVMRSIESE